MSACPASAHNQSSDDKVMMIEVPPAAANADIEIEPRMPQQSTLAYGEDTVEHSTYWVALRLVGRDFLENIP